MLSNSLLLEESDDSLLETISGIFFKILGGCELDLLTYLGVSCGFLNGAVVPDKRSRSRSRNSVFLNNPVLSAS